MISKSIADNIARIAPKADPRLVYAYLLLADFRFSEISQRKLNSEIRLAVACIDEDPAQAERLAVSYGL